MDDQTDTYLAIGIIGFLSLGFICFGIKLVNDYIRINAVYYDLD